METIKPRIPQTQILQLPQYWEHGQEGGGAILVLLPMLALIQSYPLFQSSDAYSWNPVCCSSFF